MVSPKSAKSGTERHFGVASRKPWQSPTCIALGAYVVVLAVLGANHIQHEAWRDELQAFDLARQSTSVADLYRRTRCEPSPLLWHLLLYGGTRLLPDTVLLKLMAFALASIAAAILLFRSPFQLPIRLLLVFGYFSLWEYGTISRSYGLGYCLFLVFMTLYPWQGWRMVLAGAVLALLCQTSVHAGVLAAGLLISLAICRCQDLGGFPRSLLCRWFGIGGALFAVGLVLLAFELRQAPESQHADLPHPLTAKAVARGLAYTWDVLMPIPPMRVSFWGKHLLSDVLPPIGKLARVPLGLLVIVGCVRMLWKHAGAAALFIVTLVGVCLLILLSPGSPRHHGHVLLALIGAFWLVALRSDRRGPLSRTNAVSASEDTGRHRADCRPRVGLQAPRSILFGCICVLQCASGLHASGADWLLPFSGSREAAEIVRRSVPEGSVILAHTDYAGSAVAIRLNRPFEYPCAGTRGTYIVFSRDRSRPMGTAALVSLAEDRALHSSRPVFILLSGGAPGDGHIEGLHLAGQTDQTAIQADEVYRLYRVDPKVSRP